MADEDETIEVAVEPESTSELPPAAGQDPAAATAYNQALAAQRQSAHRQALSELSAAKSAMSDSQQRMKDSLEQGDWDRLAQEQGRMSLIATEQVALEHRAAALERPSAPRDPTVDFLSGYSPAAQDWLKQHPAELQAMVRSQVGAASQEDTRRASRLQAAHLDAVASNCPVDSKQYFDHVSRFLGGREGNAVRSSDIDPNNPHTHVRGNTVFLTEGEKRTALDGTLRRSQAIDETARW